MRVADRSDAVKDRHGRNEALGLARAADRVVVARGKKLVAFDMRTDPPDDDTLLTHLLGPTGNLRAPTVRKGNTLLVGFSEEAYRNLINPGHPGASATGGPSSGC